MPGEGRKDAAGGQGIGHRLKRAMEGRRARGRQLPATPPIRRSVMMSDVRRALFSLLCRRPCITLARLASYASISRANAQWHVEKIVGSGFLSRRRAGRRVVHYPSRFLDDADVNLFTLLSNPTTLSVLLAIREDAGRTQKGIAGALGMRRQALAWHISKLNRAGLIEGLRDGRAVRYSTTNMLERRAKAHAKGLSAFRAHLIKALRDDGLDAVLAKTLSRITIIRFPVGKKAKVLEVPTDPFNEVLEGTGRLTG